MTDTDRAYLAGILDGEGYITLRRRHYTGGLFFQPKLCIGSTSVAWLKNLRELWGGIGNIQHVDRGNNKWKPYAQWSISGRQVQQILREVLPFLRIKQEQARLICDFVPVGRGKKRTVEQLTQHTNLVEQIDSLNHRGRLPQQAVSLGNSTHHLGAKPAEAILH